MVRINSALSSVVDCTIENHLDSFRRYSVTLQLTGEDKNTSTHISNTVYGHVLIHTTDWTRAMDNEQTCIRVETEALGSTSASLYWDVAVDTAPMLPASTWQLRCQSTTGAHVTDNGWRETRHPSEKQQLKKHQIHPRNLFGDVSLFTPINWPVVVQPKQKQHHNFDLILPGGDVTGLKGRARSLSTLEVSEAEDPKSCEPTTYKLPTRLNTLCKRTSLNGQYHIVT